MSRGIRIPLPCMDGPERPQAEGGSVEYDMPRIERRVVLKPGVVEEAQRAFDKLVADAIDGKMSALEQFVEEFGATEETHRLTCYRDGDTETWVLLPLADFQKVERKGQGLPLADAKRKYPFIEFTV
jgi:hypothetical protein